MIKNPSWVLAYIAVLAAILMLNASRWARFRRRRRERLSTRLGQDPNDTVALMQQIEPLWATDPATAKQILEAHYLTIRERNGGKGAAPGKGAATGKSPIA
jgi:hypothetical protein